MRARTVITSTVVGALYVCRYYIRYSTHVYVKIDIYRVTSVQFTLRMIFTSRSSSPFTDGWRDAIFQRFSCIRVRLSNVRLHNIIQYKTEKKTRQEVTLQNI